MGRQVGTPNQAKLWLIESLSFRICTSAVTVTANLGSSDSSPICSRRIHKHIRASRPSVKFCRRLDLRSNCQSPSQQWDCDATIACRVQVQESALSPEVTE